MCWLFNRVKNEACRCVDMTTNKFLFDRLKHRLYFVILNSTDITKQYNMACPKKNVSCVIVFHD